MASLTYYGSSVLDTGGLGTASKMAPTTGGSEISKQTVFVAGAGGAVFGEVWSQGTSGVAGIAAIPAPTGRGWIFYPGAGTFSTGNWSAIFNAQVAQHAAVSSTYFTMRFSLYHSGAYTTIGTLTSGTKPFSAINTKTQITLPAVSFSNVTTGGSDGIYIDLWWFDNSNVVVLDNPTIYESSSATNGVANDMAITTSNFTPATATSTRSLVSISAATQALGVARDLANISAATQTTGATTRPRPISGVSVSLQFGSPLSLYGTTLASPTLASAKQALANTNGASSAGYDNPLGTATGYSELYPTGTTSAWQALGALPGSATTHGYLLDSTLLEGQTILSGDWTDTLRARINGGTDDAVADFYTRVYKRSSAGVYTLIATLSILGQTVLSGISQNFTLTGSGGSTTFATGDKLYFERFANVTGSVTSTTAAMRVDTSSSTTLGSDNCQLSTPGMSGIPGGAAANTALALFFSSAAASTLANANKLYTLAGAPTNTNTTTQLGTATNFGELWARGTAGTWAASGSLPAPTGHGFIYDTSLSGQTLAAGNYSATIRLQTAGTGASIVTVDIHYRLSKYTGGSYTTLIDLVSSGVTINTTAANYSLFGSLGSSTAFGSSEYLAIDVWLKVLTNTGASTQTIRLSGLSQDAAGGTGALNAKCLTPGLTGGTVTYNTFGGCLFNTGDESSAGDIFGEGNFLLSLLDSGASQVRFQIPWKAIERPVQSTSQTTIAAGSRTIVIDAPIPANFANGVSVKVGIGAAQETVTITTWASPNLTATFTKAHTGPYPVMVIPQNGDTPGSCGSPARVQAYDWSRVDDYVRVCQAYNLYCVFVLQNAPDWHTETLAIDASNTVPKATDAGVFTTALMQRIHTTNGVPLQVLEVANEGFNSGLLTSGNAAAMFGQLLTLTTSIRTAALAVQSNLVIGPACALTLNPDTMSAWVNGYFSAGLHTLCDYGAFHFYPPRGPDDPDSGKASLLELIGIWESVSASYQPGYPVKITEIGWTFGTVGDSTYNSYLTTALSDCASHPMIHGFYLYDLDSIVPGTHFNDGSTSTTYITWRNASKNAPTPFTKTRSLTSIGASVAFLSHTDDFNRTIAGGLGTASDGDTYTFPGGGNGTWSCVGGSYAQLTNTTVWNFAQHGSTPFSGDMDITFDWWSNYNVGPGAMVFFRGADANNCYGAGYQNGALRIMKWTAGVSTTLTSQTFAITVSTWYSARVQVLGSTILVRAWLRGNTEPTTWNISTADSAYSSGLFGLLGYAGTAARVLSWDNLVITRPTAVTARSITNVSVSLSVTVVPSPPGPLPGQVITNGVSNYIFGVHDHGQPDMSVPSPTTAMINLVKGLGIPTLLMRTFFSNVATDAQINQRITDIGRCGGVPLVCLQTPGDATFNKHVVTMLGSDCLIYEFGNEPTGTVTPMSVAAYSAAWNAQIPALRTINPQAAFIGPAMTKAADSWLQTWLDNCVSSGVVPSGVSFHTYPCTGVGSATTCLPMAANLGTHLTQIRGYVTSRWPNRKIAVGVTEWNVDAAFPTQSYAQDEPFVNNFYLGVLQGLIKAGADFACQFSLFGDGNNFNMINDTNGGTTNYYAAMKNAVDVLYVAPHARAISGVTVALGALRGYSRTITGVSSALKALGVPHVCTSVTAATKAFDVPHRCFPVTASIGLVTGTPVLAVAVSGMFVPVQQAGISFDQRLDDRAGGSFVTDDATIAGIYPVQENQQVGISDSNSSLVLYRGFVESIGEGRLGNSSIVRRAVTLKDLRALAEKRLCTADYTGWTAGNIAAELVRTIMAQEQIAATFAMRHDMDASTFGQGTLSGLAVSSDDGSLELAKAGADVSDLDTETADFAQGTLSGVTASDSGALTLKSYTALKMAGQAGNNVGVNKGNYYTYWSIWQGSITINAGDFLEYSMWMSSSSADLVGGIDLQCSDKWCLKDSHWPDQYGIDSHPGVHMGGWADDQWLYRKIPMPPNMIGKTIKTARIALEADKEGSYCFYARNVRYKSSSGATRATIFDTTLQRRSKISNVGYYNIVLKPVTVYEERGNRVAPALSLDGAGIAGQSLCSWSETLSTQTDSSSSSSSSDRPAQVLVETSMDGGDTWQTCTNNAAIPSLPVGMDLTNKSLLVKQTLCIAGPNPELPPVLNACSVSVEAAYASSKIDVGRSYSGPEMNDGTNSWCGYQPANNTADGWQRNDVSGLKMNGWRKNWRTGEIRNIQLYGTSLQQFGTYNGGLYVQCGAGTGAHVHFSDAGTYSSLVVECDLRINTAGNVGILYNTTYWGNTNNSWGYYASISTTAFELYRGSNSSSSAFTNLWSLAATFDAGQYYHMKVVLGSDHIHHLFLDDIEYITWTDGTYTSGGVGVRTYSGASDGIGLFDNFGVSSNTQIASGVRTAPSVSLAGAGSVGDSHIWWGEDIPSGCTLDVSTSLDNGASYTSCTNGQAIPGLAKGNSLAGKSLLVKIILTSDSISYTPSLLGISWLVTGAFSASGNRVSPALLLSPAGTMIGSSSITWDAAVPQASGTLGIDSSLNGTSWNVVSASGDPVAGLVEQGDCWWDSFDSDSHTSYTYTTDSWLWDIAHSRLVTQGTTDTDFLLTGFSSSDVEIMIVTDQIHVCSIPLRKLASDTHYYIAMGDNSGPWGGFLDLRRVTPAGGNVLLASASIDFVRGTYHAIHVILIGSRCTVWFDETQLYSYVDGSPITGAGSVGLNRGTGTSHINDLAIRPLGQDATGKNAYTRVRLSSTDPLTSPKVTDLVACVRSPLIATGVIIPQTKDWAGKQTVAGALDEIAKESNMSWRFNESFQLVMQPRDGQIAPFVLATVNGNIDAVSPPKVTRQSPAYRNRQVITGAVELVEQPESKLGNGVDTSWSLTYPIESLESIQINGQSQTFGIKDTDTGRLFYYTPGEKTLSLDSAQGPPTSRIDITYIARKPYTAIAEDKAQQSVLALLEGASGIYEASEDIGGLSSDAADTLAQARLTENGRLSINWSCTTLQSGLGPGQLLTVMVPEHDLVDLQFLITSVSTQIRMQGDTTLFYWYDIEATTGPSLGSWSRTLTSRLLQKG